MKKLITMLFAVCLTAALATEWFPMGGELTGSNIPQMNTTAKDTTWYSFYASQSYIWSYAYERATFINVEELGLSYPVNFGGVQSFLYDTGATSNYRIVDRDGVTVLWEKEFTSNVAGYEIIEPDAPIILNNDFYIVHVPDSLGLPRMIYDDGSGPVARSYYRSTGSFRNLYDVWGANYNFCMAIGLEQYTGPDITGPSVRNVYGTDAFMGYDANLVLTLTDEGSVSTITGAYTINDVDWFNFDVTAAKANYYEFSGAVPGQADGTDGKAVFFITDNSGNETTSNAIPLSWSIDNPLITQGFETNFPPVGWSTDYTGDGFIQVDGSDPLIKQVHSGNYAAAHKFVPADQDDWLISPLVSIPADNSSTLIFWQNNVYTSWYELHEVAVSTDMVNWTTVYSEVPTVDNVWEQIYVSLSSYVGQDLYFGFHYTGNDCDSWYIDDFAVYYDYEGPTVVDLVGNEVLYPVVGAYLNNDMPLTLTVNDLTGVQSVTGHYSFDEGSTINDLVFSKAKGGDEVWTAVIPQLAAVDSGYITFDMTDIGGIVNIDSTEYRIDFVLDTEAPVFTYVKGTVAYINNPMDLEIGFSDESAISSCSGFYSKDNGATWTSFDMSPAKINDYVYTGSIPAETAELLDGQVYFGMKDAEDIIGYSGIFTVKWVDGQTSFIEDFESGAGNWTLDGNWAIVEEGEYISSSHALTESPGGDYEADELTSAQWATPFDLSAYLSADLSFWLKYDIEEGFDYMYFEGSQDGGVNWIRLKTFDGEGIDWYNETIPMSYFCGKNNVTFRFLFESDGGYQAEGMYIDDLMLVTYNTDYSAPSIISDPYAPLYYEGVVGDYTDAVEVYDASGLSQVSVYYSVDGGAEDMVTATNTTGDFYEFTIPAQTAGSQIDYRIYAVDSSAKSNEGYSDYYSYVAGDHMIYDAGIVSYYHTLEDNDAYAVRVTVPGSDESKTIMTGKLAYLLLRTYEDLSGHVSDDMQVHVWDDNAGLPGTELVVPFDFASEGLAMTRVDMRSYDLTVSGDFWIGVSSPYGTVYTTMEAGDEEGTTEYGRSYYGAWNGVDDWNWTQAIHDNWHFRAVLDGIYTGIEDVTTPFATELMQNYPNPFNPATTINFNLAKDSKVSLVVYDVMGREVANLVNKNMVSGSHTVTFDASRLVSGVYYYTLKAGEVNQTRKMMLIK